jgi:hypothetical protein
MLGARLPAEKESGMSCFGAWAGVGRESAGRKRPGIARKVYYVDFTTCCGYDRGTHNRKGVTPLAKKIGRYGSVPSTDKQTVRTVAHGVSAALWVSSLDKAAKKGGLYWIPVVMGALGHLLTEFASRRH